MNILRSRTSLTALALITASLGAPVLGQDALPRDGVGLDHDFDDGLEIFSDVGLTLVTRTRSETLEFKIGTELFGDYTDGGTDDFDFRDSSARLSYTRTGANAELQLSAGYVESNLADEIVDGIISDGGVLTTTDFTGSFESGRGGPVGLSFDARYRTREFTDADADLVDDTLVSFDALARFNTSRNMSLRARAGISRTDEDDLDQTVTEITYFGLGASTETAGGLSLTGDILFDRVKETTATPVPSPTEDGLGFELALSRDLPNGTIGATLSSRIDEAGRRTTAMASRQLDTKTGGIAFSLGLVDQEDDDELRVVGGLDYSIERPGSVFSASLERTASTDDAGTTIDTSLRLAYSRDINAVSGWQASLGYFATDDIGGEDDNRTTATLSYTRDLTEEWSMRTGYSYSKDDGDDAENSIFFSVQRDITFGF